MQEFRGATGSVCLGLLRKRDTPFGKPEPIRLFVRLVRIVCEVCEIEADLGCGSILQAFQSALTLNFVSVIRTNAGVVDVNEYRPLGPRLAHSEFSHAVARARSIAAGGLPE